MLNECTMEKTACRSRDMTRVRSPCLRKSQMEVLSLIVSPAYLDQDGHPNLKSEFGEKASALPEYFNMNPSIKPGRMTKYEQDFNRMACKQPSSNTLSKLVQAELDGLEKQFKKMKART